MSWRYWRRKLQLKWQYAVWRLRRRLLKRRVDQLFDPLGWYVGPAFPDECVSACTHPGDDLPDVVYWRNRLDFQVPRARTIAWLAEYGAWEQEEMEKEPDDTLANRVLWLACHDVMDNRNDNEGDRTWDGLGN
jgi:hypothetical protein